MIRRWHLHHNKAQGLAGLSGYYEDYQYMDALAATGGYSDAGTNIAGSTVAAKASSDWLGSLLSLGSTYLQGQTQQNIAKTVVQGQQAGTTTTYYPSGQVVQASATPVFSTAGFNLQSMLSNPLVLGAVGLGAYLLFKKKKK